MRTALLLLLALALVAPAGAQAAPTLGVVVDLESVRYGRAHELTGTLIDGAVPLGAQEVVLEGRRYPFEGSYRVIARTTTGADGKFSFKPELDRNHRLRVSAPAQRIASKVVRAYVVPSFELSFRALRPGFVRLTQRYSVPKTVRLTAPTLFYLGPRGAKRASKRVVAELERTGPGRYRSVSTVELPTAWHGAFRYASCFRASHGTGMGDPAQSCPRLRLAF